MDGTVRLWDLKEKKRLLIELRDPHCEVATRGVKGFDVGYSNTIVSWGFESHLSIWAPEYSIVRPYSGMLKSNGMIIDAKCVKRSTILISYDNKNTIRIWDQRRMICLQSLSTQPSNLGVLVVEEGFIMYGRRMTLYELAKDNNSQ
jgi:WD40 repeat protein